MNVRREGRYRPRDIYRMVHFFFLFFKDLGFGLKTALHNRQYSLFTSIFSFHLYIPNRLIKNTLQVPLGQRRTLKILVRLDLLSTSKRLVVGYWLHALLAERLEGCWVVAKIELGADEDDGDVWSVVLDLWEPLVCISCCAVDRRRLEEHWEGSESRVVGKRTLALTLSKDGGETMEKQMRKTSVCG